MKKMIKLLLLLMLLAVPAQAADYGTTTSPFKIKLLDAATTTGAGTTVSNLKPLAKTYQLVVSGTGSVSATVQIQGSHDGTNWILMCTLLAAGTTTATDGCAIPAAAWMNLRANVTAISGTSATATVTVGG